MSCISLGMYKSWTKVVCSMHVGQYFGWVLVIPGNISLDTLKSTMNTFTQYKGPGVGHKN